MQPFAPTVSREEGTPGETAGDPVSIPSDMDMSRFVATPIPPLGASGPPASDPCAVAKGRCAAVRNTTLQLDEESVEPLGPSTERHSMRAAIQPRTSERVTFHQ